MPWLCFLLAAALGLRVAAAFAVQHRVDQTPGRLCLIAGDAEGYWELARRLARGDDYAIYDPPRHVLRVPGFPLVLAACIRLFGERVLPARIVLAFLGTLACGLVYWFTSLLFDRRAGLVAGLMAAICPTFVVFSVLLLSETTFAVALLASLIAVTCVVRQSDADHSPPPGRTLTAPILAGLLCGAATLVRPTWLLVAPGVALVHWLSAHDRRRALRQGMWMLAGLAAALAPWTIRNAFVTGHFVPTTLWVGPSLYDGLNPQATGASDMQFVEDDGLYGRLTEYEADRHYRTAAWDFAARHPGRAAKLALAKLWRFWNPFPNAAQFDHPVLRWGTLLWTLAFFGLAVVGAWRMRGDLWTWLLPAGAVLYFSLVHLVFVGSVRYRLPAEYPLAALAACGVTALWNRTRGASAGKAESIPR